MSNRQRNHKRNKHLILWWWRGDNEDTTYMQFPTKEDAWASVLGKIRKTIKAFKEDGETVVDFENVKKELFEKGQVQVEYANCVSWWHTFQYSLMK